MEDCENIVRSVFPDVQLLRKKCAESGFLPPRYRGEIWSLFLSGGVLRDEESFDHTNEQINYREIHSTCAKVLRVWQAHGSRFEVSPHFIDDLSDILALYCKRMNIQFKSSSDLYLLNIILPMLSTTHPLPRSLASSCFYALCTSFLPLSPYQQQAGVNGEITYETIKHNLMADRLSSWLRLLLSYHFPALAIHLDSIHPGWETVSALSRAQVFGEQISSEPLDPHQTETGRNSGGGGGLIPASWLGGYFAGSFLSSASLLRLWDWCLLWEQKFASLYLTAALLGLHEDLILAMTTPSELADWVQATSAGGVQSLARCKVFQAASSYRPHETSLGTEPVTPSRLFGDDFDDDDDFSLSSTPTHDHSNGALLSLLPLKDTARATHSHELPSDHTRSKAVSVSIGWDGEADDQSDSGDEAAAAFFAQCAIPATPPVAPPAAASPPHSLHQLLFDTPPGHEEERPSEETFTQVITLERLEELFLAGWIACTSRMVRTTPVAFQTALSQVTEWAASRAREEFLSRQSREDEDLESPRQREQLSKPVPVEYQMSDELDQSSHNWEASTRARAPSSPGNEETDERRPADDDELCSSASPEQRGVSKFQLIVDTSNIAAVYGKSIWGRVSLKVEPPSPLSSWAPGQCRQRTSRLS
jgi:hypothetical protein